MNKDYFDIISINFAKNHFLDISEEIDYNHDKIVYLENDEK